MAIEKPLIRRVRYRITPLAAVFDDDDSIAMNNNGDILNEDEVWRGDRKKMLRNTLKNKEYRFIHASGMNNQGVVVGSITGDEDGAYLLEFSCAVIWRRGRMTALLPDSSSETVASGINNAGDVIGHTFEQTNDMTANTDQAFLIRHGRMTNPGRGGAACINDRGQIVVTWSDPSIGDGGAYLWEYGHKRPINAPRGYSGFETFAGMNDRGQVVGEIGTTHLSRFYDNTDDRAFIWQNDKTQVSAHWAASPAKPLASITGARSSAKRTWGLLMCMGTRTHTPSCGRTGDCTI